MELHLGLLWDGTEHKAALLLGEKSKDSCFISESLKVFDNSRKVSGFVAQRFLKELLEESNQAFLLKKNRCWFRVSAKVGA